MSDNKKPSKEKKIREPAKSASKTKAATSKTKVATAKNKKEASGTGLCPSSSSQTISSLASSQPSTSAQSEVLTRKSSKNKLVDVEDQPLDLSLKRQRTQSDPLSTSFYGFRPTATRIGQIGGETNFKGSIVTPFFRVPQSERPWGTLYFYENQKFVLSYDLYNYLPIKITGQTILGLKESQDHDKNVAINYNDWQHIIGKGFTLRKSTEDKSVVEMQRIDESADPNKYKVIIGNKAITVETNEVYQIYNGNEYEKDMVQVDSLESAHNFVHSCYALIGIHGKFFNAFPMAISINQIRKENMGSMPYWFVLKLNTEYALLDKQVCSKISPESKS